MIFINLISAIDITMNTVITVFLIIQTLGIFFPRSFRVEFKNLQHFFFFKAPLELDLKIITFVFQKIIQMYMV